MDASTSESLRAQLVEARQRLQREVDRTEQLQKEVDQAAERQSLRDEIELVESDIKTQESINQYHLEFKNGIDQGNEDREDYERDYGKNGIRVESFLVPQKLRRSPACDGEALHASRTVRKGEFVWKIEGVSWLTTALKQENKMKVCSEIFDIGSQSFSLVYSTTGRINTVTRGTLAIYHLGDSLETRINLRYRMLVKNAEGEFVQWGETGHECYDEYKAFFGPDVRDASLPVNMMGIFGLSHDQLVESDWVQNDTLTVKAQLELREPDFLLGAKPLDRAEVKVPPANLHENLLTLFDGGKHTDVTFLIEGEHVKAHSLILSARSEVFEKELSSGMRESISKEIVIPDCDIATFRSFLRFLYTDDLSSIEDIFKRNSEAAGAIVGSAGVAVSSYSSHLQNLLAVSHKYQVVRLQCWCEQKLCECISVKEVCSILRQAHLYQAKQLEHACLAFVKERMALVSVTPGFRELLQDWPELMLTINMYVAGVAECESAQALQAYQDSRQKRQFSGEEGEGERAKRKRGD